MMHLQKEISLPSHTFAHRFSTPLRLACFVLLSLVSVSFLLHTPSAFAATRLPAGHASAQRSARSDSGGGTYVGPFLQTATTSNTVGDLTYIDNPQINGNPNLALVVEANWNPGGIVSVFDNHLVGVLYDLWQGKWAILNEDGAAMPVGAQFNYTLGIESQTAAASSVSGNQMVIDPQLSGPGEYWNDFEVTPNASPNGIFDSHPLGIWYNAQTGLWVVYHEDLTPIQIGETFNLFIETNVSELNPWSSYTPIVTANTSGYACTAPGQDSGDLYVATHNFTIIRAGRITSLPVYITGVTGMVFSGSAWCVFEYGQQIPAGTQFALANFSDVVQ